LTNKNPLPIRAPGIIQDSGADKLRRCCSRKKRKKFFSEASDFLLFPVLGV